MGVQNTKGHCAGNGGLRGHSVGAYFPCIIYQKGTPDNLTHWVKQPNGVDAGPHSSYDEAALAAQSYNNGGDDWLIYGIRCAKVVLNEQDGETQAVAYSMYDELPFDCYGLYGMDIDGSEWHICDYFSHHEAANGMALLVSHINDAGGVGHGVSYRKLLGVVNAQ